MFQSEFFARCSSSKDWPILMQDALKSRGQESIRLGNMKLPADITAEIVRAASQIVADRLAEEAATLKLYTIAQAAKILEVSEPKARRLVSEYVELGEASKRVSAATLRKLITDRTMKAERSRGVRV